MTHNLSHTIRLYPTSSQETFFKKASGCSRVAYNYGLSEYQKLRSEGKTPVINEIKKQFNQEKKTLYPWMSETNKDANQQPFANLQSAFGRFFKHQARYPVFKKKGIKDSFYISNDKFSVHENRFRIPKLGWVKGAESLRFEGKINSATIRRKANYWFIVISVETEINPKTCENQTVVGVDLGIKTLATLSDGTICEHCGQVIDRDLNAAINLRNYGLNQLRAVSPEVTPMDKGALTYRDVSETTLEEVGISICTEMYT